jgi:hypothetical protein
VPFRNELRPGIAIVGLLCTGAIAGGCATSARQATQSRSTTSTTPRSLRTTAPLTAKSFFIEPCASIVGSPILQSKLNLTPMLLGAADLPSGATLDGPHRTSPTVTPTWASVPTTSPAAYETVTLSRVTSPGGTARLTFEEVIGDVGSLALAGQLLAQVNAGLDAPTCKPSATVQIPGTDPMVTATLSGGEASSGSLRSERLFAAVGSRMLCLTWSSQVQIDSSGLNPVPTLPALPGTGAVAQVLRAALEQLTS